MGISRISKSCCLRKIEAQLEALRVFLRRKKVVAYHRDNYGNMLKYIRRLLELVPGDKKGREELRQEIITEKALAERTWLLEQVQ